MSRGGRSYAKKPADVGLLMECYEEELSLIQAQQYNKGEREYNEVTNKLENMIKSGGEVIERGENVIVVQMSGNNSSTPPVPSMNATTPTTGNAANSPIVRQSTMIAQPSAASGATVLQTLPTPVILQVNSSPVHQTRSSSQIRSSGARNIQNAMPILKQSLTNNASITTTAVNKVPLLPANQSRQASPAPVVDLTDDDTSTNSSTLNNNIADSREVTFNKLSGKTFPSLVVVARPNLRVKDLTQSTISQERSALDAKVKSVLMFTPTKFTEWLIQQGLVKSEQYCSTHFDSDMSPVRLKLGMYSDVSKFPYSGGYVWISECCPQRFVSVFSGSIFEGAPHPPTVLLKLIYHWACQTNVQNVVQWVKVANFYVKNFFTNMRSVCTAAIHEKYEKMGGLRKRVEVGVISLGTTSQDGNMRQVKVEVLGVMDPESKLVRLRAVEPLQDGERNYKKRFVKILEPLEQWVDRESIILTDFTVDKGTLHNMGFNSVYQVSISENPSPQNKYSNQNVMEYLRRIVPRMFQNTLSLLSHQIIQQFLDELVWRERFGPVPSQAFDSIITHLAEQTKLESSDHLLYRLSKVSANPFRNWNYSRCKNSGNSNSPPVSNGTPVAASPLPTPPKSAKTQMPSSLPGEMSRRPISSIDMLPQSIRNVEAATTSAIAKRGRKRPLPDSSLPEAKRVTKPRRPQEIKRSSPAQVQTSEEQVPLDSYYYGTLEGNKEIIESECKSSAVVKCCVCQRKFTNNIQLMKHLILHAQKDSNVSSELSDVTQCKYCLKNFPTPFSMQVHVEEVHLKTTTGLLCRICDEKFRDRTTLVSHMHRTHVSMELPYSCGVCNFRSSIHRDVIDHFYEVHKHGEKMQCPFCLKTVAFSNNGRRMTANIYFFLSHMQKHQQRTITRKCTRCSMWFVHKGIQKEHQLRDHNSYKDVAGVKPFVHSSGIMMPIPLPTVGTSHVSVTIKKTSTIKLRTTYATKPFESLTVVGVDNTAVCCECEGSVLDEEHFQGYMTCNRCRYATCCNKAMAEHAVVFHEPGKMSVEFHIGRIVQLPKELYCVCGFHSSSGNRLAKHLAMCEHRSAYPSPNHANAAMIQSASFPPLVTLDDAENASEDPSDQWLKAFVPSRKEDSEASREAPEKKQPTESVDSAVTEAGDPPSMLNILGLVRKPSTDESSLERAPSDSEGASEVKIEETVETAYKADDKMDMEEQVDINANKDDDSDFVKTEGEVELDSVSQPEGIEHSPQDHSHDGEGITMNTSMTLEGKVCNEVCMLENEGN